jgi:hypothetical protein
MRSLGGRSPVLGCHFPLSPADVGRVFLSWLMVNEANGRKVSSRQRHSAKVRWPYQGAGDEAVSEDEVDQAVVGSGPRECPDKRWRKPRRDGRAYRPKLSHACRVERTR